MKRKGGTNYKEHALTTEDGRDQIIKLDKYSVVQQIKNCAQYYKENRQYKVKDKREIQYHFKQYFGCMNFNINYALKYFYILLT